MSTIAEFTIEPGEFLLGGVVADVPDLSIELERIVPLGRQVMPYLWCYTADLGGFTSDLEGNDNVTNVTVLDRVDGGALYRIEWALDADSIVTGLWKTDATLLEATADDVWQVRLLFEDRQDVRGFDRYLDANDVAYRLERVYSVAEKAEDPAGVLTDQQRDALVVAADAGYFAVPRETTMADLGRELGISEQATSERIRRGVDAVLDEVLAGEVERRH